jgi:hypothetical protein
MSINSMNDTPPTGTNENASQTVVGPHPPIMPQADTPVSHGPVTEPQAAQPTTPTPVATLVHKKLPFMPIAIILGVVAIIVVGFMVFTASEQVQQTPTVTPTPTATSSTVSNRTLTAIATESAFVSFEGKLDELTRGIQNTQVQNQQLLPPRIELPLGF